MKNILFFFAALFISGISLAQNDTREIKTIFGEVNSHGFYLGFTGNYTQIDSHYGVGLGGKMAWVIGHNLAMGFAGSGFITESAPDYNLDGYSYSYSGGYGGFFIEPIIAASFPVHFAFPILVGAGGLAYSRDEISSSFNNWQNWDNPNYWDNSLEDATPFFVIEPGAELEFNLFKHFRFSAGAYYRNTSDIHLSYRSNDAPISRTSAMDGLSYGVSFKFGKF